MEDKSNIYLDAEDDITAIIKKVEGAREKAVNLVVPKRSSVLESVVNLKLIKKSAAGADKKLALISDDPKISSLAARLDILMAPNLKVPPQVPEMTVGGMAELPSDTIEDSEQAPAPVAAAPPAKPPQGRAKATEDLGAAAAAGAAASAKKKKSKIPDFNSFKKRMLIAGLAFVGLLVLLWIMFFVLPKAVVTVQGRTQDQAAEFNFTVDTSAQSVNLDQSVLPGQSQELDKTLSGTFKATGKKDAGTKATGTVSVQNKTGSNPSFSAGTSFTASNGKVFTSNSGFTVPPATVDGGGNIVYGKVTVPVTAAESGDSYNIASTSYTNSSLPPPNYVITGSTMEGGSSKTVAVVTQADIDAAAKDLLAKDKVVAEGDLKGRFSKDFYVLSSSMVQTVGETTSDPPAGGEGDTGRLTIKVNYVVYGVKEEDMHELLKHHLEAAAKKNNVELAVADDGLDKAQFSLGDKVTGGVQNFHVKTQGLLGPDLHVEELKQDLKGKSFGETINRVKAFPNVTNVDVKFSPFWVRRMPRNANKIIIQLDTKGGTSQ